MSSCRCISTAALRQAALRHPRYMVPLLREWFDVGLSPLLTFRIIHDADYKNYYIQLPEGMRWESFPTQFTTQDDDSNLMSVPCQILPPGAVDVTEWKEEDGYSEEAAQYLAQDVEATTKALLRSLLKKRVRDTLRLRLIDRIEKHLVAKREREE